MIDYDGDNDDDDNDDCGDDCNDNQIQYMQLCIQQNCNTVYIKWNTITYNTYNKTIYNYIYIIKASKYANSRTVRRLLYINIDDSLSGANPNADKGRGRKLLE